MENEEQKKSGPKSIERRRFLELTTKFGFTAATVALFSGVLHSKEASAQVAKEEAKRQLYEKSVAVLAEHYDTITDFEQAVRLAWLNRWGPEATSGMVVCAAILRSQQLIREQVDAVLDRHAPESIRQFRTENELRHMIGTGVSAGR